MGQPKNIYHELQKRENRMQLNYARKVRERQTFMEDLKKYRERKVTRLLRALRNSVGPRWYHELSVLQRMSLDKLEVSLYQDLLEGLPTRTLGIIKALGVYPRPHAMDLMHCIYVGRNDPKQMLAQLFFIKYGHTIDDKRNSYDLNGKLLLTGIFYLGLENLIHMLQEQFRPNQKGKSETLKPKSKITPRSESPYLQKLVAHQYEPQRQKNKHQPPLPLPNLDSLNKPLLEAPPLPKFIQPPPPSSTNKTSPHIYCDNFSKASTIEPYSVTDYGRCGSERATRKVLSSKYISTERSKYGIARFNKKFGGRQIKPKAPTTGMFNTQYTICGVYTIHGKTMYVIGNVSILPAAGDLIHGGFMLLNGEHINIHCGIHSHTSEPKIEPCDCIKKWTEPVFQYVKRTKCYCGHYYDYGNEGEFSTEELPFFEKSNRHALFRFNYDTIYELDPKRLHIEKKFKNLWETESLLRVETQQKPQKKKKPTSTTCLGDNPKPQDYLRCALYHMRRDNIAARLPDIHLVPELVEWMRRRLYGPRTRLQKAQLQIQSNMYWQMFEKLATQRIPRVPIPKEVEFTGQKNWKHKQSLNDKFRKITKSFKLDLFRHHAELTNLIWPSMCQVQLPDKKFREIYFLYLFGTIEDFQI